MNKGELVTAIAKETGVTKKDIEKVLKALTGTIQAELKNGGKIQLPELGSFKAAERAAREVRNPRTGKKMQSPACKVAKFTAAKALKDAINA